MKKHIRLRSRCRFFGLLGIALLITPVQVITGEEPQDRETTGGEAELTVATPGLPPVPEALPGAGETGGPSQSRLAPFGYEQFQAAARAQAVGAASIPDYREDYRLGSGDRVGIYVLGRTELTLTGTVGIEGNLPLSGLGLVKASGLTLGEFQAVMDSVVHRYYKDVQVECALLQPRHIPVWLTGEVRGPGKYVLSAVTSLSQALAAAGGPTERASFRRIRIRRADGDTSVADLYGLLALGDRSQDFHLESGDVVFVPVIGKTVAIHGEVKRPAVFELKGGERLSDVIGLAGGYTSVAYLEKIQLTRRLPDGERRLAYLDCREKSAPDANPPMLGDEEVVVFAAPWYQAGKRKAYFASVEGEARCPGVYAITKGERLSSLLKRAGGFTDEADLKQARLIRPSNPVLEDKELARIKRTPEGDRSQSEKEYLGIKTEQESPEYIIVDFQKLWMKRDPGQDVGLKDGDRIVVPKRVETVILSGRFNRPGSVVYKPGADVEYYIKQAGGLAWNANPREMRIIKPTGQRLLIQEAGAPEVGDVIWVPRKGEFNWWKAAKDVSRVGFEVSSIYFFVLWAKKQ